MLRPIAPFTSTSQSLPLGRQMFFIIFQTLTVANITDTICFLGLCSHSSNRQYLVCVSLQVCKARLRVFAFQASIPRPSLLRPSPFFACSHFVHISGLQLDACVYELVFVKRLLCVSACVRVCVCSCACLCVPVRACGCVYACAVCF